MPQNSHSHKSPLEYTVLLLISEPLMRQVIGEVVQHAGYMVLSTGDLGTAVDRLKDCSVDLLIVSPYVETMSGHDAAKYLQGRCPSMRILMVAGFLADDRLRNRAVLERVEIFPQPFTGPQLLEKIRTILDEPRVGSARV
jgi:DNA-binding NtrC family response regulator